MELYRVKDFIYGLIDINSVKKVYIEHFPENTKQVLYHALNRIGYYWDNDDLLIDMMFVKNTPYLTSYEQHYNKIIEFVIINRRNESIDAII